MKQPHLSFATAALAWFVILLLAIANGALREALLIPRLGRTLGTGLSGVLLIAAITCVTWILVRRRKVGDSRHAWLTGASWLIATLCFEFGFGRLAQGKSWSELLAAYTFENGNLWPLVLLALLVAPYALSKSATG